MRTTLLAAAAAATLVLGTAPAAHAYGGLGCGLSAFHEDSTTGQNAEGMFYGGPFTDTGAVAIWCYLTVNGTMVSDSPTASGTGVVSTSGRATFNADTGNTLEVCTKVTVPAGVQYYCVPVVTTTFGPVIFYYAPQPMI